MEITQGYIIKEKNLRFNEALKRMMQGDKCVFNQNLLRIYSYAIVNNQKKILIEVTEQMIEFNRWDVVEKHKTLRDTTALY